MAARGRGACTVTPPTPDWLRFPDTDPEEPAEPPEGDASPTPVVDADDWWGRDAQFWLVLLAAVGVAAATLLAVSTPPAAGFETSLPPAFPLAYWVAFYGVLAACVAVYFLSAADGSAYWKHALALVLADYAVYFFLPLVRGYLLYGRGTSDILVHIGDVKNILATGSIWSGSWYPVQHVFISELVLLGFPLRGAEYVVEFAFTAVFVASFGALLRTMTDGRRAIAYGLAAGTPLVYTIFQTTIIPSFLSVMLFPTVLLVLERVRRSDSPTYLLVLTVFAVGIALTHPVTGGLLAVLVVASTVIGVVYSWRTGAAVERIPARLALLVVPVVYAWYINFRQTETSIRQIALAWATGGTTPVEGAAGQAAGAALTPFELVVRFVQLYGVIFVFLGLAGLFGLYVAWELLRHRRGRYAEVFATGQFGVGFAVAVGFFTVYLIEFEPTRVSRYLVVMAVLLVGLLLVRTTEWRPRRRTVAQVVLALSLVSATALGANAAYTSNKQLTQTEYEGVAFSLTHKAPDAPVRTAAVSHKIEWYTYGDVSGSIWPPRVRTGLPDRLGYTNHTYANQTFPRTYVATLEYDRRFYTDPYFTPAQQDDLFIYGEDDLETMRNDPTVARVYDNGAFETWYIAEGRANTTAANGTT
ncbi:glycosyltransferase family protein [Halocalculus aciditolerans]|uniref:hypothetical protein n=1 Tax=Halocalculus aciditolerans TaxID=1383812 RepID=UPI0016643B17|nr:hypothetical protein [Halocalculus aciditolerans]